MASGGISGAGENGGGINNEKAMAKAKAKIMASAEKYQWIWRNISCQQ
jgi:hypothetical protein